MKTRHPTPKDIQELLAFLPAISEPDFVPVKDWDLDTKNMFPSPDYDPLLQEFMEVINKPCWSDYDYGSHPVVLLGAPPPGFPANADLPTLRAVLTKCVRVDRFCDGALGGSFESGLIRMMLERLAELNAQGALAKPRRKRPVR